MGRIMIPTQPFGATGHDSTLTLFGGAAFSPENTDADADGVLELLLRHGVNHIDTAHSYGQGNSEVLIGAWMQQHRDRFFLATKTGERTAEGARTQFDLSRRRLCTDTIDLIQLHNLTDGDQWEVAMGPGGALEALVAAREQGSVRFIGVTGHGLVAPRMHLRSLERFPFDAVLLPMNYVLASPTRELPTATSCASGRCAPSATWRCNSSRPWRDAPGPAARAAAAPGTSRSTHPKTSPAPSPTP